MRVVYLPDNVHLTPDQVRSMTIRQIKSHLMVHCDFSAFDVRMFFELFARDWRALFRVYSVPAPTSRREEAQLLMDLTDADPTFTLPEDERLSQVVAAATTLGARDIALTQAFEAATCK